MKFKLEHIKTLIKFNLSWQYCSICSMQTTFQPTASLGMFYDRKYRNVKYYVKCRVCQSTTPAYESANAALKSWNDFFALKEDGVLQRNVQQNL